MDVKLVDTVHGNTASVESKDYFSITIELAPLTGLDFHNKTLGSVVRDQFPSGIGLKERRVDRQCFVEIDFPSVDERDQALLKPFVVHDQPLQISQTLDSNAIVAGISIAEIPHEQEAILKPKVIDVLSQYGTFLRLGYGTLRMTIGSTAKALSPPSVRIMLTKFCLSVLKYPHERRIICFV
ncbi:hypothetical protein BD560DRAFT_421444 [Blakeslea trispora]|nr:hypothetical protein BD560DRAFT_421444 [Blakeslea trispora]